MQYNMDRQHKCTVCKISFSTTYSLTRHMALHSSVKPFVCSVCREAFSQSEDLANHMKIRHMELGQLPYECNICQQTFTEIGQYETHMATHMKDQSYKCSFCIRSFCNAERLAAHIQIHTGDRPYECNTCEKRFVKLYQLNQHKKLHKEDKKYHCEVCSQAFTSLGNLTIHLRSHTGEKPYECAICKKSFSRSGERNTHMKIHTGERKYACVVCNKRFIQAGHLYFHMRIHTGERPYGCTMCDKRFIKSHDLVRHKRIHTQERPHQCEVCNKSFTQSGQLRSHMKTHTGDLRHECPVCQKAFPYFHGLKVHLRTHTGYRPYKCTICKKTFTQSGNYYRHKQTHYAERQFICVFCNEAFKSLHDRESHMRLHTGQQLFECKVCHKAFSYSGNRSIHMRIHEGPKPHQCSVCKKSFKQKCTLEFHMGSHTSDLKYQSNDSSSTYNHFSKFVRNTKTLSRRRPFECNICKKTFTQSSVLKLHVRTHSEMPQYECKVCKQTFMLSSQYQSHKRAHFKEKCKRSFKNIPSKQPRQPTSDKAVGGRKRPRRHECKICHRKFPHSHALEIHIRSHTGYKPYECSICKKRFAQSGNRIRHMRAHIPSLRPECDVCKKTFADKYGLRAHMKLHNELQQCECTICSRTFSNPDELKTHVKFFHRHDPLASDKSDTPINFESRPESQMLTNVEERKHSEELVQSDKLDLHTQKCNKILSPDNKAKYECPICKKSFNVSGGLAGHMKIHRGQKKNIFETQEKETGKSGNNTQAIRSDSGSKTEELVNDRDDCSESVITYQDYTKSELIECSVCHETHDSTSSHQCQTKSLEVPFQCYLCSRSFADKNSLQSHMYKHTVELKSINNMFSKVYVNDDNSGQYMNVNNEDQHYECGVCKRKFNVAVELTIHMKKHKGERVYQCDLCKKAFRQTGNLIRHMRLHTGDKPFQCAVCKKRFTMSSGLNVHMRTHTNTRPYECKVCKKRFRQVGHLSGHMRLHSPQQVDDDGSTNRELMDSTLVSTNPGRETIVSDMTTENTADPDDPKNLVPTNNPYEDMDNIEEPIETEKVKSEVSCSSNEDQHEKLVHIDAPGEDHAIENIEQAMKTEKAVAEVAGSSNVNNYPETSIQCGDSQEHFQTHAGEIEQKCCLCNDKFSNSDDFDNHLKCHVKTEVSEHDSNCNMSEKASTQVRENTIHRDTEIEVQYHCSHCQKTFTDLKECDTHVKTHNSPTYSEKVKYVCYVCHKTFENASDLNVHSKTHSELGNNHCTLCNETYDNASTHTCPKKSFERPFKCGLCSKSFTEAHDLEKHMQNHTAQQDSKNEMFRKVSINNGNYANYMIVNSADKYYECLVCKKMFAHADELTVHMKRHIGCQVNQCDLCGKVFKQCGGLLRHSRLHTGERPYECSICKKKFIMVDDIKMHMRTHTDHRPHECKVCKRKFRQKSHLVGHLKTHSLQDAGDDDDSGQNDGHFDTFSKHDVSDTAFSDNTSAYSTDQTKKLDHSDTGQNMDSNIEQIVKIEVPDFEEHRNNMEDQHSNNHAESSTVSSDLPKLVETFADVDEHLHDHISTTTKQSDVECNLSEKTATHCRDVQIDTDDQIGKAELSDGQINDDSQSTEPGLSDVQIDIENTIKAAECSVEVNSDKQIVESLSNSVPINTEYQIKEAQSLKFHSIYPIECRMCNRYFATKGGLENHMRTHTGEVKSAKDNMFNKIVINGYNCEKFMIRKNVDQHFECGVCRKLFTGHNELTVHMAIHIGEQIYECKTCRKVIKHCSALLRHARIHAGEKPYECAVCKKRFTMASDIRVHMRSHSKACAFECEVCKKKFRQKIHLRRHMQSHTLAEACGNSFDKKMTALQQSAFDLTSINGQRCQDATLHDRTMAYFSDAEKYDADHTQDSDKDMDNSELNFEMQPGVSDKQNTDNLSETLSGSSDLYVQPDQQHQCYDCGMVFENRNDLDEHLQSHVNANSEESEYQCSLSDEPLTQPPDFPDDITAKVKDTEYKCSYCQMTFQDSREHDMHIQTHQVTHNDELEYKCDVSDKIFMNSNDLEAHMPTHTDGEADNSAVQTVAFDSNVSDSCQPMEVHAFDAQTQTENNALNDSPKEQSGRLKITGHSKVSVNSDNLTDFMIINTEDDHYKCGVCKRTFAKFNELIVHMESHKGEQVYRCEFCRKGFKQSCHFLRHMMIHTGEKPFKCNICKKNFSNSSILNVHERTHTNFRPFECKICKKAFRQSGHLSGHMRVHGMQQAADNSDDSRESVNSSLSGTQPTSEAQQKACKAIDCNKTLACMPDFDDQKVIHDVDLQLDMNKETGQTVITEPLQDEDTLGSNKHQQFNPQVQLENCLEIQDSNKLCNKTHSISNPFNETLETEESSGDLEYNCDISEETPSESEETPNQCINVPEEVDTEIKENQFERGHCQGTFTDVTDSGANVQAHVQTWNRELEHKCIICSKSCTDADDLEAHMTTHRGQDKGESTLCHETYENASSHNHNLLSKILPALQCNICSRSFSRRYTFERHMETHLKAVQSARDMFGKVYINAYNCAQYMIINSEDEHFECGACKTKFATSRELTNHTRKHIGEWIFRCNLCKKSFRRFNNLSIHMRIHTGEKPFECIVCQKRFRVASGLTVHMRTHDGTRPFECELCHKKFRQRGHLTDHIRMHRLQQVDTNSETSSKTIETGPSLTMDAGQRHCETAISAMTSFSTDDKLEEGKLTEMENREQIEIGDVATIKMEPASPGVPTGDIEKEFRYNHSKEEADHCPDLQGQLPDEVRFECNDCNQGFASLDDLYAHSKSHTDAILTDNNDGTGDSDKQLHGTFTDSENLDIDMKTHNPEPDYESNLPEMLAVSDDLPISKSIKIEEPQYECRICKEKFTNTTDLESHVQEHTGRRMYACSICGRTYTYIQNLNAHMKRHDGLRPWKCNVCSKAFARKSSLDVHMRTHNDERNYKCTFCDKTFTQAGSLSHHLNIHTKAKQFSCIVCNKFFTAKSTLKVHMRIHTGEKPYQCTVCGKLFRRACDRDCHQKIHTGERNYKCDICGKAFVQSGNLAQHVQTHNVEKRHECEVCNMKFKSLHILSAHMKRHNQYHLNRCKVRNQLNHEQEKVDKDDIDKRYKCTVCGKVFSQASHCKRHMRVHTGERPYECKVCKKRFSMSSGLAVHMRIHTGEKPYECKICNRAFAQVSGLSAHLASHGARDVFQCTLCSKPFTKASSLEKHMKHHF